VAGDRDDDPGTDRVQPWQVLLDEGRDPRALEAARVEHARGGLGHARRPPARDRVELDGLRDERAEPGDVDEAVQLPTVGGAAARGHHRARQAHPGEVHGHVDHQRPPFGAPTASSGTRQYPSAKASHRTRSPRKTGPSTQLRAMLVVPSASRTGMTQVMQMPTPQAMASSTATWATMPCSSAMVWSEWSMPIGPQP